MGARQKLRPFEETDQLPVRHAAVVFGLFPASGVEVVVDDVVAEGGAQHFAANDPGQVVIDEIAGQFLTLLWLPVSMRMFVAGFLLFRILDILKPFPARRLEALHGGSGIMADDLLVAVYANLILRAVHWYAPDILGG